MTAPVFLGYCHEHDAAYVDRLVGHLAAGGVAAWHDPQHMSDSWWETYTRSQIESCSAMVVVMTPEAEFCHWLDRELVHARAHHKPIHGLLLRGEPFPAVAGVGYEDVRSGGLPGAGFLDLLRNGVSTAETLWRVPLSGGALALAVGIETRGGVFTPLIANGSPVPCSDTEIFTTAEDDQPAILVKVFAGPGDRIADAKPLGSYAVVLPRPAPRGIPQIHITFHVAGDGTFRLTAAENGEHEIAVEPR